MKIGLVTDSASDIAFDYAKKHNIKVTPLDVTFDDTTYKEDENFDFDHYYKQFEERELFKVKTSQPSPGAFLDKYEELINEGYEHIICATISSGLSGTYNSAVMAGKEITEEYSIPVDVVDGKSASVSVVYLIELAIEMIDQGKEPKEIVKAMRERVTNIQTYLTLPSLKYLRAGGRVSITKFLLGRLFGLKPITHVNVETGENEAIATVRNLDKGLKKVYNLTTNNGDKLASHYSITHTNDLERANKLVEIIKVNQPNVPIRITRARSSISAHAGPGAIALISLFE